jgi:hypothetical protein
MQKEALIAESAVVVLLLGMVIWQRYQRALKKGWKAWRGQLKRCWTLRPRTPDDCLDCPYGQRT